MSDGNVRILDRPAAIRYAITAVSTLDREWTAKSAGRDDPRCTPWMPFPLFDFIALVAEALPETPGDRFCEIGAGIGTRMLIARDVFGLDVHGIERRSEYADQARQLGLDVQTTDALGWTGYGQYDLLWFNRPFRDPALQQQLEQQVWHDMKPGAVVICANLEGTPPTQGWNLILDDSEVRRWIWQRI